ncbi:hypothetical protein MRB53_007355 [Persea americana]|uniref:Uncharacterized protein n=1 Tax=Persea americana TaxID=3435 RepID=A0ACC2MIS1_PERAE|nr:hypothetical protein MRB53_007355 [Persea americana]
MNTAKQHEIIETRSKALEETVKRLWTRSDGRRRREMDAEREWVVVHRWSTISNLGHSPKVAMGRVRSGRVWIDCGLVHHGSTS